MAGSVPVGRTQSPAADVDLTCVGLDGSRCSEPLSLCPTVPCESTVVKQPAAKWITHYDNPAPVIGPLSGAPALRRIPLPPFPLPGPGARPHRPGQTAQTLLHLRLPRRPASTRSPVTLGGKINKRRLDKDHPHNG